MFFKAMAINVHPSRINIMFDDSLLPMSLDEPVTLADRK